MQRQVKLAGRPRHRRVRPASRRPATRPRTVSNGRSQTPFASSFGIRLRNETSLTRTKSRIARGRLVGRDAHRHVVGDHRHLGLEIDAVVLVVRAGSDRADRGTRRSRPDTSADRSRRTPASRRRALCAPARRGSRRPIRPPIDRRAAGARRNHARGTGRTAPSRAPAPRQVAQARLRPFPNRRGPACSVGTMKKASVARVRSRETTTSRPSRPCLRDESFIAHQPNCLVPGLNETLNTTEVRP